MGAVTLTSAEASAMLKDPGPGSRPVTAEVYDWPDEGTGYPGSEAKSPKCTYPEDPACSVPALETMPAPSASDDSGSTGAAHLGAFALGGAGVAFGGMWLYRRRRLAAG
jgi:hypothetical protein